MIAAPTQKQGTRNCFALRRLAAALLLGTSAAIGFGPLAWGHPDIKIENRVTFIFKGAQVTGIEESWTFDPNYSKTLLADYATNGGGNISAAESRAMGEHILPNLAEVRYFTYVWVDGHDLGTLSVRDFNAIARGGRVTFTFVADLPSPVDPLHQALKVEINDRDYYAGIRLMEKEPVRLQDPRGIACAPRLRDDVENAYFGYVYPQEITLSCR